MKHYAIFLFIGAILCGLVSCTSPTPEPITNTPISILDTPLPTQISILPSLTPEKNSVPLKDVKFVTQFSDNVKDWQILPGSVTAAEINAEVARREGNEMNRVEQKVINGFLRVTVEKVEDGQVFEILFPAELANKNLVKLTIKNVKQVPVLSSYGVLLENYFAINFPDAYQKWKTQGATDEDLRYAVIVTVTWATKFGPLRVSYVSPGKYITEADKYPGRVDFFRECMYEQTQEHFLSPIKLDHNLFAVPIVELFGTTKRGVSGKMKSDAFGWAPMLDFAKAQDEVLSAVGKAVNGIVIESEDTLAEIQSVFDRIFMPVHCIETVSQ